MYYYGRKSGDASGDEVYNGLPVSFFYSSIDVPFTAVYTFNTDSKLKFRLTAGVNGKLFRLKRNYYSIFSKSFDYFFHEEVKEEDRQKREFMIEKINPFILFSRAGAGIQLYNITADLCIDKNLTGMNRMHDPFNANYKDSYIVNLIFSFTIPQKDLRPEKQESRIIKK